MRIELHIEQIVVDSALGAGIDRDGLQAALVTELAHGLSVTSLSHLSSTAEASRPGAMSLPPGARAHTVGTALGRAITASIVGTSSGPHAGPRGGARR